MRELLALPGELVVCGDFNCPGQAASVDERLLEVLESRDLLIMRFFVVFALRRFCGAQIVSFRPFPLTRSVVVKRNGATVQSICGAFCVRKPTAHASTYKTIQASQHKNR